MKIISSRTIEALIKNIFSQSSFSSILIYFRIIISFRNKSSVGIIRPFLSVIFIIVLSHREAI